VLFPLPSATRRGIEGLFPHWGAQRPGFQPLPFASLRPASFAQAKLNSAQAVDTRSGDTSQCGVCLMRWWAPACRVQGPLRCLLPRSVLGPMKLALRSACGLPGSLSRVSQAPPLYRTQTLIALERITSGTRCASTSCRRLGAGAPVQKGKSTLP
jgi:hypothetical protein